MAGVAGVALGDIHLRFARQAAWQAGNLWHWACSGGALGRRYSLARDAAALCVARLALGDIHLRFTWQAWRFQTSTSSLRGRRGTYGTGLALVARSGVVARDAAALCVAGVELGDIHPCFARQTWHLAAFTFVLRGRRGGKHQHEHTWPRAGKP